MSPISSFNCPCESQCQTFFVLQNAKSFDILHYSHNYWQNGDFFEMLSRPDCTVTCSGLDFNSPKDVLPELTGLHFSCSEHISWEVFGIWPRLHFLCKDWCTGYGAFFIFPKMLRLKCQLENLGICLYRNFISITRNVDKADIRHLEEMLRKWP